MISAKDIQKTYKRISPEIEKTPLLYSPKLSEISGAKVYLKLEHQQKTGSFKIRGVLSKIFSLNKYDFNKVFVASSTGNHAAAFCDASEIFGFKGVLFLSENISKAKLNAINHFKNVKTIFYGKNSIETEQKATEYAKEIGGVLIHPYNDIKIIEGQGTIGLEIKEQLPKVDTVLAPIGGGGLISGLCLYFKDKDVQVIGCQPKNASEMMQSIKQNKIVPPSTLHTIADASAGGIEKNAITFNICKNYLSGFEIIDEEAIKKAVAFMVKYHQIIIEPAAAIPIAALLNSEKYKNRTVALVLSGKKINTNLLTNILTTYGDYY